MRDPSPTLEPPGPSEAHLWLMRAPEPLEREPLAPLLRWLAPDEVARYERYLVEHARDEFFLTRVLVRSVLSRYAAIEPEAWEFERNEHGRPEVSGPEGAPRVRFNLSNTRGLIACMVRGEGEREVGVDVEDTERKGETVRIAEHFFAPEEVRSLRALPEGRQRLRFFEHWTLKEAYIKARGMGLAIPLDRFAFHLDAPPAIRIAFDPRLGDDASSWQFGLSRPSSRHMLAWAVRRPADAPPLRITTFEVGARGERLL